MADAIHGRLIVAGGSYWKQGKKYWTGRTDLFDPETGAWQAAEPLPEPRSDAAAATVRDVFYLFGGGAGEIVRRDALAYRNGHWTRLAGAQLPAPRLYAMSAVEGGLLYVSGGIAKAGAMNSAVNSFWSWDPAHPKAGWLELPPIPGSARFSHGMIARAGQILVMGGGTPAPNGIDVNNLNDAYCYHIPAGTWTRLPNLPVARRAWGALADGRRILLFGGYTAAYEREILSWDPETGRCEPATPLPHPLADAKFFRIGSVVVGAGGETADHVRGPWTLVARTPGAA
jgi:N-acetylneuraminic acid mutarotase